MLFFFFIWPYASKHVNNIIHRPICLPWSRRPVCNKRVKILTQIAYALTIESQATGWQSKRFSAAEEGGYSLRPRHKLVGCGVIDQVNPTVNGRHKTSTRPIPPHIWKYFFFFCANCRRRRRQKRVNQKICLRLIFDNGIQKRKAVTKNNTVTCFFFFFLLSLLLVSRRFYTTTFYTLIETSYYTAPHTWPTNIKSPVARQLYKPSSVMGRRIRW